MLWVRVIICTPVWTQYSVCLTSYIHSFCVPACPGLWTKWIDQYYSYRLHPRQVGILLAGYKERCIEIYTCIYMQLHVSAVSNSKPYQWFKRQTVAQSQLVCVASRATCTLLFADHSRDDSPPLCVVSCCRRSSASKSAARPSSSGSSSITCATGSWCGASRTRGTGKWPTSTLTCSARRTPGPRWETVFILFYFILFYKIE